MPRSAARINEPARVPAWNAIAIWTLSADCEASCRRQKYQRLRRGWRAPFPVISLSARLQTESFASPPCDGFALDASVVNYKDTGTTTCRALPTLNYGACRQPPTIVRSLSATATHRKTPFRGDAVSWPRSLPPRDTVKDVSAPRTQSTGQNTLKSVLAIAIPIVEARIADAQGRSKDVLTLLRQAVAAEDRLAYDEPKNWFFPARHLLGFALLKQGAASEAESVYREDLRQSPANGWSLYGLSVALKTQGKATEAAQVAKQFAESWRYSDVTLTASAF
jgi:hypothetical protein